MEFARIKSLASPFFSWLPFVLALLTLVGCQAKETYPSRPILLICPWAVGGGTDRLSREVAVFLEQELAVPVNVVNATGGAGVTGHSRGASARPDGYTLTMMTVELNMLHWRELTEISWKDFTPVMLINRDPAALFTRADENRWEDLNAIADDVRKNPGTLAASGTATGGIWHLALAGWLQAAGLKPDSIKWIPTNGAGPALQELVSGGVDLVCCSLPEARTLLAAGKVQPLGVMAESRVSGYPDVPTFQEQGINWAVGGWRGLGLPQETSQEIVNRLAEALLKIVTGQTLLNGKGFPWFMENEGFNLTWEPSDKFRRSLERADQELGSLLTSPEFSQVNVGRFQPMDFPKLLFGALAITLLALLVRFFSRGKSIAASAPTRLSGEGLIHFLEIVLAVAAFALLAEKLGFVLTAASIIFLLLWRLGTRIWVAAVVTLFVVPAVYGLFGNLLRVPLPRGILGW
ncbi:tripartite tricarboxylate transporter TctB family protein [Acidobacteria bacterium AH-259-G07]|nr:tripartite tricarboxylate transporter TctB family protein [Acidobacteria bacterium AH-259-G07]